MNRNIFFLLPVLLVALLFTVTTAAAENRNNIRALFIYGGHAFDEEGMYAMLDSFSDVTFDRAEMPMALDLLQPGLEEKYDCIVTYDSYTFPFTQEQTDRFKALLNKGIGLVVLHHSLWGFNGWAEFADITGAQFFFKDGNIIHGIEQKQSTWAHNEEIRVTIADKNHPITRGMNDFTFIDEVYGKGFVHPDVHVLWTTDHPKSERVVAWTHKYGKSPIFTTSLGHDKVAFAHPDFRQTIHRAIRWATEQNRSQKAAEPTMTAGVAKVSINPEQFPVIVNGGYIVRYADKVVDPVNVRAMVLNDGTKQVALAVIDACILDTDLCNSIRENTAKETGIPVEHILVSATHTHLGGSTAGVLGTPMDQVYSELVRRRTIEAIVKAASNQVPVRIGWGAADHPEGTHCRIWITRPDTMRTDPYGEVTVRSTTHPEHQDPNFIGPSGPVNSQLTAISLQTLDGKPFAVYVNYPMHFFGVGADGGWALPLSSDYFGPYCDKLEQNLGMDSTGLVLLSNGTTGDQQWWDYGAPLPQTKMSEYAAWLAEMTENLLKSIEYHPWAPVDGVQVIRTYDRRVPDAARLAWAREKIAAMGDRELAETLPEVYAQEAVLLHETPRRDIPLQALRIGDVGITALAHEVYGITGLKLAWQSPFSIQMTVELANGGEGYIPPPEVYPFGGYNSWAARSAALVPSAEPEIIETSLVLLESLAGRQRKAMVPTVTAYSQAVLASHPLVFWRMNNFAGTLCPDAAPGGRRPGTYRPCTAYGLEGPECKTEDGKRVVVPSVHFAGGSVDAMVGGLPQNYTFEAWIWNGLVPDNRAITGYIFSRGGESVRAMTGDHLGIGGTYKDGQLKNRLFLHNGYGKDEILFGKTEIPYKKWVHVAMTREGNKVSLYVDGQLDVAGEIACTFVGREPEITVGNRSDRFSGLEGKMAEAALYPRVLTAEEIARHRNAADFRLHFGH